MAHKAKRNQRHSACYNLTNSLPAGFVPTHSLWLDSRHIKVLKSTHRDGADRRTRTYTQNASMQTRVLTHRECVYADDNGTEEATSSEAAAATAAAASSPSNGCASVAVCDAEIGRDEEECVTSASEDRKEARRRKNWGPQHTSEWQVGEIRLWTGPRADADTIEFETIKTMRKLARFR
jgi:hypothetical protein